MLTKDADKNLKLAAEMKNDQTLLLQINGVYLIAKEFKYHEKCYRNYTRILYPNEKHLSINEKGDSKAVCTIIEEEVIALSKAISMNVLIHAYPFKNY